MSYVKDEFEGYDVNKIYTAEEVLTYYIREAKERNEGVGIEGFTGDETPLCLEGVKATFPELSDEEAKEVVNRYNRMIEDVRECKGAEAFAKECTAEEVANAGNTLVSAPQIEVLQAEPEK